MAHAEIIDPATEWVRQYEFVLRQSGLDRHKVVCNALSESENSPSAMADRSQHEGLFSLADCLAKPSLLINQVRRDYMDAEGPAMIRARISVLQQDLALSVIAPLTLRLFRDQKTAIPDPNSIFLAPLPAHKALDITQPRWFQIPGGELLNATDYQRVLGKMTSDWYPIFRHQMGLSPGAYWSSVGLGLGAPFSAVWNLAEPNALCALAQRWLEAFSCSAAAFIDWIPAVFGDQATAIPQRKGCCLKYLLPDGGYCGTCGVHRKHRLSSLKAQNQPAQGRSPTEH